MRRFVKTFVDFIELFHTPWQADTRNKILVLEEVGEKLYRIDRLLWQLQEAGMLDHLAGLILGSFTSCEPHSPNSFTLEEILAHYFADRPYPVLMNFPTGHGNYQATLPLNAEVELDSDRKTVHFHFFN